MARKSRRKTETWRMNEKTLHKTMFGRRFMARRERDVRCDRISTYIDIDGRKYVDVSERKSSF